MKPYNMYRLIGYFLLIMAFLSGCELEQDHEGSGTIISQRRSVGSFESLSIDGVLNVYLSQESASKVVVKTDDNLIQEIKTETKNNTLYIYTSQSDYEATLMDVYVSVPDLTHIKLDGVTALYCEDTLSLDNITIEKVNTGFMLFNAVTNHLNVETSGSGDLELHGKSLTSTINNSMVGDFDAFGFKTQSLELKHNGTGDVKVYATSSFSVELTGVGDVYCKGSPSEYSKSGNGAGRVWLVD